MSSAAGEGQERELLGEKGEQWLRPGGRVGGARQRWERRQDGGRWGLRALLQALLRRAAPFPQVRDAAVFCPQRLLGGKGDVEKSLSEREMKMIF